MDYIKPTPIVAPLSSATWGVAGVLPRDLSNGIESAKGAGVHPDYYYWDGQIIRATDGKYHLFLSTFSGDTNFGTGWLNSDAYHAVSQTNVLGPYVRQDYIYSNNGSHKGHNVTALELPGGTYAVVVSETVPFTIYQSSSLDGPWTSCQPTSQVGASNISLIPRHDGRFQIVERNGTIAISDTLCGTYVKQTPTCAYTQNDTDAQGNPVVGSIYAKRTTIPGVPNPVYTWQEDPHIWRSGGVYHVIYSGSGDRVGWHVYSTDGLNWKDNGYGWSPREYQRIFCYEGTTTCTQWYKMERPGVVLQDGHPTHITWAVADVDKDNQVLPGTNHGTKIIVVPFDGVAFDNDFGVGGAAGAGGAGTGGAGAGGAGAGGAATGGAATGGAGSGGAETGGAETGGAGTGGTETGGAGTSGSSSIGGSGGNNGTAGTGASAGGLTAAGGTAVGGSTSGQAGTAGVSATGGAAATGGTVSSGAGGQLAAGGLPGVGGAQASGGSNADTVADTGGCGCRVAGGPAPSKSLAVLGILALFRRRRSRSRNKR
jgi:MYXO-CTERM domain-containing protein